MSKERLDVIEHPAPPGCSTTLDINRQHSHLHTPDTASSKIFYKYPQIKYDLWYRFEILDYYMAIVLLRVSGSIYILNHEYIINIKPKKQTITF